MPVLIRDQRGQDRINLQQRSVKGGDDGIKMAPWLLPDIVTHMKTAYNIHE